MSVVNLNKQRKERARKNRKARAAENVVIHGRTKAEKALDKAHDAQTATKLDNHKRTR